jgi:CRISPR-associated endoribonuclease Cas6
MYDNAIAERVKRSALLDNAVCCGMSVKTIKIMDTPSFSGRYKFKVASPVLVRKFDGERIKHLVFTDESCDDLLTQTLVTKLKLANLPHESARVSFDRQFKGARTKLVTIKGIKNRTSICPVIVEGSPEVVRFAWDVGVGHSTGSGFGSLH